MKFSITNIIGSIITTLIVMWLTTIFLGISYTGINYLIAIISTSIFTIILNNVDFYIKKRLYS